MCKIWKEVYLCGFLNEVTEDDSSNKSISSKLKDPAKTVKHTFCRHLISANHADNEEEGEPHTPTNPHPDEECAYVKLSQPCREGLFIQHIEASDPRLRPCRQHEELREWRKQKLELKIKIQREELKIMKDIREGKPRPSNIPQHPGQPIYAVNTQTTKLRDRQATLDFKAQLAEEEDQNQGQPAPTDYCQTLTSDTASAILNSTSLRPKGGAGIDIALAQTRSVASARNPEQNQSARSLPRDASKSSRHSSRHSSKDRSGRPKPSGGDAVSNLRGVNTSSSRSQSSSNPDAEYEGGSEPARKLHGPGRSDIM